MNAENLVALEKAKKVFTFTRMPKTEFGRQTELSPTSVALWLTSRRELGEKVLSRVNAFLEQFSKILDE